MARGPDCSGVQGSGCYALGELAEDSPANGAAIRQAGGTEAVTAAMALLEKGSRARTTAANGALPSSC